MILISVAWLATAALAVLKLAGIATISWFVVFIPVQALLVFFAFLILIAFLILVFQ